MTTSARRAEQWLDARRAALREPRDEVTKSSGGGVARFGGVRGSGLWRVRYKS